MRRMRAGWPLAGLALAACLGAAPAGQKPVPFACDGDLRLLATFAEDSVRLELPDNRALMLPRVTSASGARYAGADIEFWNKGRDATLMLFGGDRRDCTESG